MPVSAYGGQFVSSCCIVGMDVTIFNPRLDADGTIAESMARLPERCRGRA